MEMLLDDNIVSELFLAQIFLNLIHEYNSNKNIFFNG
jgi:hypothetical protein